MEQIAVNEYVRTQNGLIKKVKTIYSAEDRILRNKFTKQEETLINGAIKKSSIIKHSFNIIDLIEVGDIIITKHPAFEKTYLEQIGNEEQLETYKKFFEEKSIILLSILTKEMYTANCYEVK